MDKVNYIVQLNAVFDCFYRDSRIKQGHITLYLSFFQKWNREYFKQTLTINREQIMDRAKIKSKTTYHNYLRDLNDWGYLQYYPSYHPARGSKIKMAIFFVQAGQNLANSVPEPGQKLVSSYKHKTNKNLNKLARPKNELEVLSFFKSQSWPIMEGKKFYSYFEAIGWKMGGKIQILNWQACANSWMLKANEIKKKILKTEDNLKVSKHKNYNMPL